MPADTPTMIISEEQARIAARYARNTATDVPQTPHAEVSRDVIEAATALATSTPDIRPERIEDARLRLDAGELDARDVACKMLSRIVSDSLR